jgi:hypothetical protein
VLGFVVQRFLMRLLHPAGRLLLHFVEFRLGDLALGDQLLGVQLPQPRVLLDLLVHQRLRERRVVLLVVPVPPVAPHVDHHVAVELLPERHRQPRRVHARLRVVAVDVEHRRLDRLGDVGRVRREPPLLRHGREADLVVDDDVDRAAGAPVRHLRQPQRLHDDALAGEGRVAVDQERHHARAAVVPHVILLRADDPLDDRIHQLQVARVERQRQVNLLAVHRPVVRKAQVILDVPVSLHVLDALLFELRQDHLIGLVQHVRQHVEPPPVRHADDHLLDAEVDAVVHQRVDQRHHPFAPLHGKSLLPYVPRLEVLLESLGRHDLVQQRLGLGGRELGPIQERLHPLDEPFPLGFVGDVHELDADRAAVGRPQLLDQVAQGAVGRPQERPRSHLPVQVVDRQPELRQLQEGVRRAVVTERVEPGDEMAQLAVGVDQVLVAHRPLCAA